ncbi:unnamed protein product [Caenorhabditis nigoni]
MMVKITISEDVVMCFKYCANRHDYTMFIAEYESFLNAISELLKPASFPKVFECNFVSMHLTLFVDVLLHWNASECSSYLESHVPELLQDVKYSMSRGFWDPFYWKYRSHFDYMISKSRNQRVIDFRIECNGDYFESFEQRDSVCCFKNSSADMPPFVNTTIRSPVKSKNSAQEEEKKFGRHKAQTNVQNGRTRCIVTSGSLPPPVSPGAGFRQVRCGHPFSELSLRIFNFVIGVIENDSTGSTDKGTSTPCKPRI